jgi:transposase
MAAIKTAVDREGGEASGAEIKRARSDARRWPAALKQEAVAACLSPGARIIDVARRYGVHPQQLTKWRRAARDGRLATCAKTSAAFVRVEMVERTASTPVASGPSEETVEIVVGRIMVRLRGVSPAGRIADIVAALERGA